MLVGWGWLAESSWLFGRFDSVVAVPDVVPGLRGRAPEESSFSLSVSKTPGSLSPSVSSLSLQIKIFQMQNRFKLFLNLKVRHDHLKSCEFTFQSCLSHLLGTFL